MDSSLSVPEQKKKKSNKDGEPLTWDEIIGKLLIAGQSRGNILDMTLRNAYQALEAHNENMKLLATAAGASFKDDSADVEIDAGSAAWLEAAINASVRG